METIIIKGKIHSRLSRKAGFSLIEIMVTVAILAIVVSIAIPAYQDYLKEGQISVAVQEIRNISLMIEDMEASGDLPASLTEVGVNFNDPWGNPYQYLNVRDAKSPGEVRKDKSLTPINTDYDLYSMGPDGESAAPLTAAKSRDDIVRANDGGYIGEASGY